MSESNEAMMQSIGDAAEAELWLGIRREAKRKLAGVLSIGLLYVLSALAVGGYLIMSMANVGDEFVYFSGWQAKSFNLFWMKQVAMGYAGLALLVGVGYVVAILLIFDKLPAFFYQLLWSTPWLGSTVRAVVMGEFCQSMVHSLRLSKTYGEGLSAVSTETRNAGLGSWAKRSAHRFEAGFDLDKVLRSSPMKDQPLSALATFLSRDLPLDQSTRVWHSAAVESHLLVQSRLARATMVISTTCLLVSVMLASLALFFSGTMMQQGIRGFMY